MSELSFLGLSVPDKKDVNQEKQSNDYLMNFEENSSPESNSINSNMAENQPPANLIDSSFKMADISTDFKDESGIRDDEKNPVVGELVDSLVGHVEFHQNELHDESIKFEEEFDDKENEQPSKNISSNSSFRKNLSFEMLEARVEQKRLSLQSNLENQREILKEIKTEENLVSKKAENEGLEKFETLSESTDLTTLLESLNPNLLQTETDTQCLFGKLKEKPETKDQFSNENFFGEFTSNDDSVQDLSLFGGELDVSNESTSFEPQQKFISIESADMKTTFTTSFPFTLLLNEILSTEMNLPNNDGTLPLKNDSDEMLEKQSSKDSCGNESPVKNDDEIKKSIDDEMNHESNVQIEDEKTVTVESTDVSNTSLDKSKDGTLNESIYRYMTSMTQSPPPEIFIVSNDDEVDNQSENNSALSDVGSESFVDAQDEFLDQTLTDHDDNEEDYDEKVSTPTTKSPDHTLTNCKQSLNIDHLNVSPCCTLSNNSTLIKSPKLLAGISADDQECSFTYEDRLELLQTKITYEKQIVELHEKLDQQKDDGSVQVSKMQAEQIDHIRKEYDIQCQKSQDQLEQQKNRYETIVGQLEEAMEQLRMSNASMKNQYETNALAQINELKQRHEQLSIKLYESQDENQKLNDCILEMAEQRGHLRENMESLKSNMIELNNRLVESVHERESLKSRLNDVLAVKSTFEGEEKMQNLISDHLEELNKLKLQNDKTITDLQNEINNLNFTIESNLLNMNNLNDQLVLKNEELEKNRHELSKQNEKIFEIETKLKRVECENEKLKLNDQRIEEFETKINDLESKLAELKIENDSLKKDIQVGLTREKKYDVKLNDSKSEISKLMIVNQELSNAKIELEEARSSIENRLFDCEEQNVLLETKLEQIEQQIKQEQEANVNKQVEMVEKITRLEQIVCDKDVELEFLKTNNHRETQELRGKIEQAEMVHCDLQKLYDDFQAKHLNCDHIYDENQRLHNETEKLRKDNKDLNEKWDQFQHEWIESRTKLLAEKDCLQQSNDTMRIKIVELNDMVRESTTKTAALEAELKSGHEQLRNKLNETSQRLVETERVKSELESKNSIILEKNKKIVSEFASTEKRFCEERSLMEQKISALQKRLRMTEAERESLDKERLSLEKNLQTLQSNMEQMQTKISERDDEFNRCQNELGQQRKHIQSQQEQTNVLKEECENLKKSNTEIQQRLQRNRERYDENFNTMRQVAHKYLVAKTLIPTLQNQIKLQKEVGEKLTNEIAVLLAKVDSNKKDSIKNEKVKEILRLINDRISNLAKDTTLLIGTHSKQDPVIDANAGPRVAEGKEQMPPPQSTSTKSAFEPIELPSTDDRPKTTTKSLNVSNKENIL